jgi:hypothetical protein
MAGGQGDWPATLLLHDTLLANYIANDEEILVAAF